MTMQALGLLAAYLLLLSLLAYPLGKHLARVADVSAFRTWPWLSALERGIYRLLGTRTEEGMSGRRYAWAVLLFNLIGIAFVLLLQCLQEHLPSNPQVVAAPTFDLALNTAVSFVTNTNWQAYAGESSMSYLTQMLGLAVQNFLSAATGIAVLFALIRGLCAQQSADVGNFWVDVTRLCLYVLLPISIVAALFFVQQGAIQNFSDHVIAHPLQGGSQLIPMGPGASQEVIKLLGTNGGGFFNANSAHPLSNPTAWTNFVQMLLILLIPAALCFCFGRMAGDMRQGVAIYAVMTLLFVAAVLTLFHAEAQGNPLIAAQGVDTAQRVGWQSGGQMEGKETRFGMAASLLFTAVTTAASCGAVNNMHDSLLPLSGLVPMVLMQSGEVVFGGVGSGLYGMLIFAILTVFMAGLMIGRSPEYLGKKIEAAEMKAVAAALLIGPLLVLAGTALAAALPAGQAGVSNPGAHGFSQILYALTSAANNNGSAFAGLGAGTPFYNYLLAAAMFCGRFGVIVPVLAVAGLMARKPRAPVNAGTFPTHGPLFVLLLIGVVLMVGALTYVPALVLGPIVEHLSIMK